MESQERVELPAAFEDVDVDILVRLIGPYIFPAFNFSYSPLIVLTTSLSGSRYDGTFDGSQ